MIRQNPDPAAPKSMLVLTIEQSDYRVLPLPTAPDWVKRAYRLIKADGTAYDLAETRQGPQCDCADYIFRRDGLDPAGCKHVKALVHHGLIAAR